MTVRSTEHFHPDSDEKLTCTCCGEGQLSIATFIVLEVVRVHFDAPTSLHSGPRCVVHNAAVGGAKNSEHLIREGEDVDAVDFTVKGVTPTAVYLFLKSLPYASLLGLGKYKDFTHMDTRGYAARW